jgi:DNA-binding PucR family transcriptional regulator
LLEGTSIDVQHASSRLDYSLEGQHQGAILWSEEVGCDARTLERAANDLVRVAGRGESLMVAVNPATLWLWFWPGGLSDLNAMRQALKKHPAVRLAVGSAGRGIEGFRQAHDDALASQRTVGRLHSDVSAVHADELRLTSAMTVHLDTTKQFISQTLGDLASAKPILQQSLHTFLAVGSNATMAAKRLRTHRNTLIKRLARAEELLPRPLTSNAIHVAAALEVLGWMSKKLADKVSASPGTVRKMWQDLAYADS